MIRNFILRCCGFAIAGLLVLGVVSAIHASVLKSVYNPSHLGIGPGSDVIVIGDSHIQTGVDQKRLAGAVKVSSYSMHYLYSYVILKALLEANPQVKTVVLGYSYHNLNEYYEGILRDAAKVRFKLGDYYGLFGEEERRVVRSSTWAYYEVMLKYHFGCPIQLNPVFYYKAAVGRLTARDFAFWGKVYESRTSNISDRSLRETLRRHFYSLDGSREQCPSDLQERYLQKTAELCKVRGVRLFLVTTPLHREYRSQIPQNFIRSFRDNAEALSAGYGIGLWDFSTDKYADYMYGDADHLNAYGAEIFTRVLNQRLEEIR